MKKVIEIPDHAINTIRELLIAEGSNPTDDEVFWTAFKVQKYLECNCGSWVEAYKDYMY